MRTIIQVDFDWTSWVIVDETGYIRACGPTLEAAIQTLTNFYNDCAILGIQL